jgi:ribosomal subunit interface protein
MALRVSGKNIDIGESLRNQIISRLSGAVKRYFDGGVTGHVIVEPEGTGFRTDCTLHLSSGVTLQADGMAHDAYFSADKAAERIEKRLRRYNRRLKDRSAQQNGTNNSAWNLDVPAYVIQTPDDDFDDEGEGAFNPVVIAEVKKNMRTMAVSDAVLDLDLTGAPVLVFRHAGSGRVNIVYRRTDGNIGWIDPPSLDGAA